MTRLFRGLTLAVALFAGGLTALPARAAEEAGAMKVDDAASLFTADGVSKAKDAFHGTTFKSPTHLLVVTAGSIPENKKAEFEAAKGKADTRKRFFATWARDVGHAKDRKGDVVVLLYHTDKNYFAETVVDEQSDRFRHFGDKKAADVSAVFTRAMKTVLDQKLTGDAAKKEMDAALASATELVISEFKDTSAPEPGHKTGGNHNAAADRKGSGVGGWICMIACILLGVWLVTALIRAFTGGGGGGYGGGGYGGGYGGGGGGFFSSLLGGMFGAAAGMWMYNNFFGGSSFGNDAMAGDSYGNDGTADTGDGNYDGGAEGGDGGGDWGDDSGGGDAGGGDWGGGDAGGGGDWGGGGGDFGGGGGDW